MRADLANGHSPTTLKGDLGRARMVFNYAYESALIETPIRYGNTLKTPYARVFRKLANERGERMFSREEILEMVMAAGTSTPDRKRTTPADVRSGPRRSMR